MLFNQITLNNVTNRKVYLGAPKLRSAEAAMTDEQKEDTLLFLNNNVNKIVGLPKGWGIRAMVNIKQLLDYLPIIGPNAGGGVVPFNRRAYNNSNKIASSFLIKCENYSSQVNNKFRFIRNLNEECRHDYGQANSYFHCSW